MDFVYKLHILVFIMCLQITVFDNLEQIENSKPTNYTSNRIITVSNRLMATIVEKDGKFLLSSSVGGLATAVSSLHINSDNLWIGWPGLFIRGLRNQSDVSNLLLKHNLIPVFLSKEDIVNFYEGYSGEVLWPVIHSMTEYVHYETRYWKFYYNANRKFADTILKYANNDDVIWVHDYHLSLVPGMVREKLPNVAIGFFHHSPFPSFDVYKTIPFFSEVLMGMLGADVIAFHMENDSRNFFDTILRALPLINELGSNSNECSKRNYVNIIGENVEVNNRLVKIDAIPLGIDDKKFKDLVEDDEVKEYVKDLKVKFKNIGLLLSVGRLDYIKGITQSLRAYEIFLESYPRYIGNVILYLVVVPSRENIKKYKELRVEIEKSVRDINFKFNTTKWKPISYFYTSIPVQLLSALYSSANVCIITSFADGMNLVSKEFVASRFRSDGVLVLSKMTGAAKELTSAVLVNPVDLEDIANGIYRAFSMSVEEQEMRMRNLREVVTRNNAWNWQNLCTKSLEEVKLLQRKSCVINAEYLQRKSLK